MGKNIAKSTFTLIDLLQRQARQQAEYEQLEARYQDLVAHFYQARADYEKIMKECALCRQVIAAKQEVIEVLLLDYPHPLTRELQRKIALT